MFVCCLTAQQGWQKSGDTIQQRVQNLPNNTSLDKNLQPVYMCVRTELEHLTETDMTERTRAVQRQGSLSLCGADIHENHVLVILTLR